MKILAIDPGYERVGIAIVEKTPHQKEAVVFSQCFKTEAKLPFPERLRLIGAEITRIIAEHKPRALAIETLFFTNNQKTAIAVAQARGVALYVAAEHGLKLYEYTPQQIKIAVTSYGKATKSDVLAMTRKLVTLDESVTSDDEVDAIAIGLTCHACERFSQQ